MEIYKNLLQTYNSTGPQTHKQMYARESTASHLPPKLGKLGVPHCYELLWILKKFHILTKFSMINQGVFFLFNEKSEKRDINIGKKGLFVAGLIFRN